MRCWGVGAIRLSPVVLFGGVEEEASRFEGRISARRLSDGRTELSWVLPGEERILPRSRYLPVDARVGRWLRSSPIEVGGVEVGRIEARLLVDGRIEFAFAATSEERILPASRFLPANAPVGRWLRSSEIEVGE